MKATVLIIGGGGRAGRAIADRLARTGGMSLVLGSRDGRSAAAVAATLPGRVEPTAFRREEDLGARLAALRPTVVVDASGPFQALAPGVARRCIEAGVHYVDIADDRQFVSTITALDAPARAKDVLVASGAGAVPVLTLAVAERLLAGTDGPAAVDIRLHLPAPGGGPAAREAALSAAGHPVPHRREGATDTVHAAGHPRWVHNPLIGSRLLLAVDTPEHDLLPARHPTLGRLDVGVSLDPLPRALGLMAFGGLARLGLVPKALGRLVARPDARLRRYGRTAGMIEVHVEATSDGRPVRRSWQLQGDADTLHLVATAPAALLVERLVEGGLAERGARPAAGLVPLPAVLERLAGEGLRPTTWETDRR